MSDKTDRKTTLAASVQAQLDASTCQLRIAAISITIEYLRRRFEAMRYLSDLDEICKRQCRQWLALATELDRERTQLIEEMRTREEPSL